MAGYSIDLASISLDEFVHTLVTVDLLPSRRVLADHIERIVPLLKDRGIDDLAALKKLLADKAEYPELTAELGVDADYLTLLNREVNSYVSKPVPLAKLDLLSDDELAALRAAGIKSTKDLYVRSSSRADRVAVALETGITQERLDRTLRLANLVRVNGVGPAFAKFLLEAGIAGPQDFLGQDLERMVAGYEAHAGDNAPKLRIEDLEYVQRYCRGLSEDIEW